MSQSAHMNQWAHWNSWASGYLVCSWPSIWTMRDGPQDELVDTVRCWWHRVYAMRQCAIIALVALCIESLIHLSDILFEIRGDTRCYALSVEHCKHSPWYELMEQMLNHYLIQSSIWIIRIHTYLNSPFCSSNNLFAIYSVCSILGGMMPILKWRESWRLSELCWYRWELTNVGGRKCEWVECKMGRIVAICMPN